jgi:ribosomal protein S26
MVLDPFSTRQANADGTIAVKCPNCGRTIKRSVYQKFSTAICVICQTLEEWEAKGVIYTHHDIDKLEKALNYVAASTTHEEFMKTLELPRLQTEKDPEEKVGLIKSMFRAIGFKKRTTVVPKEERENLPSVQVAKSKKAGPLFAGGRKGRDER